MAQDYRDLVVWKKAIDLTACVYRLTRTFPKEETYGLVSQLRRASVSVASNIAEGRGRLNNAEFRQFLGVAQGSIYELQTQLFVAKRLEIADSEAILEAHDLSDDVSKMLGSFIKTLSAPSKLTRSNMKLGARS
jgi:four helix bundle protein